MTYHPCTTLHSFMQSTSVLLQFVLKTQDYYSLAFQYIFRPSRPSRTLKNTDQHSFFQVRSLDSSLIKGNLCWCISPLRRVFHHYNYCSCSILGVVAIVVNTIIEVDCISMIAASLFMKGRFLIWYSSTLTCGYPRGFILRDDNFHVPYTTLSPN